MAQSSGGFRNAGAIMMASLFLSRVLGIVRDMVAAAMFGQNIHTDAYRISYQIPDLLFFLVAGGALSSAFIPVFSEYIHTDREDDAWQVFSAVLCVMSLILILFIAVAWVFAPQLAVLICGQKQFAVQEVTMMSRIVLPSQFAFFIGALMMGTLYSKGVFSVPGLGPNIYNIGIIAGALLLGHVVHPGVAGMSWGATIGAIVANLIVPAFAVKKIGVKFTPTLSIAHPGVKKVFRLMLPVILGLSLPGVYALILQYFSTYFPEGSNSAVDAANRLMQAPLAIFGQSLALAAFPVLSQFWAQEKREAFGQQLTKSLKTVIYLSLPVSALMIALPTPIVKVLLEHGAFTPEDTARTASVLQTFSFGVAAWCLHPLLMRAYFSMQKNVKPIVMGTIATVIFLAIGIGILALHLPIETFGFAGSISASLLVIAMVVDLKREDSNLDTQEVVKSIGLCGLASAATGAIAFGGGLLLLRFVHSKVVFLVALAVLSISCMWVYYLVAKALGVKEGQYLERARRRLDKKGAVDAESETLPPVPDSLGPDELG